MLWVGLLTASVTFGVVFVLLALAKRLHQEEPIIGDGALLGRDDIHQSTHLPS